MSISLKNHEDRIKVLENSRTKIVCGLPIAIESDTIDCNQYYSGDGDLLYILCVDTNGDCSVYGMAEFGSTIIFDRNTIGSYNIAHMHNVYRPRTVHVNRGVVTFIQSLGTVSGIDGWLIILKLYYSFSYNIIYRVTHLLEKIFYVLNKGGVSL